MNYCIHLKRRKGRPYCNILKEEIRFSLCRECGDKEYKKRVQKLCSKNAVFSLERKNAKIRSKSSKLAKAERNRTSVFTSDLDHCYLCGRKKEEIHELFAGRNRLNSIKWGFTIPVCHSCHAKYQNNAEFNDYWHKKCQQYWEENIGTRDEFVKVFRRNYLNL